ncbi:unnamed protein product [Adineta steineri]|uniref:Uncharacterized protein n=1 Tax=Adineta steineri TaxID=433720 RepID=A0A815KGS3_9BILA|nr:unnamed protein product [Adineta steineri]
MFSQSQFNTLAAVNPYYLTKYVRVVRNVSLTIQADAYDIIASSNYWDDIHYGDVTYTNYVSNPLPVVIEC